MAMQGNNHTNEQHHGKNLNYDQTMLDTKAMQIRFQPMICNQIEIFKNERRSHQIDKFLLFQIIT